ncbi:MAG: phosphopantetheine-binding protein [Acidimicrobiales bacterium]
MTRDEAYARYRDTLVSVLELDPDAVVPEATWEALEVDSLAVLELNLALQDEFDVELPEPDPESIVTVGDAFAVVAAALALPA